ncbi:hypothetical protein DM819_06065 [Pseudomonas hunanensis]|uniref:Uncharacterized protein n=1 Tax=Pseudomonas hunanensis TaxID=1247546 RepID=A0ABD6MY09_9PSED|nr:hypothetical protein [Pseudomonas hunanensis]ALG88786.1 Hypothetical protein Drgb7_00045 [uncultured bacterium]NWL45448.1 hypothetical protein [Pseudomonas hunanensis]
MNAKSSFQALREPKTNEDVVQDIMNYSRYGALSQAFVMSALEVYSKGVVATPEAQLQTDFLPPGVWKGIAAEVLEKLQAGGYLGGGTAEPVIGEGAPSVVVLHAESGDVRTCYPADKQEDAITLWRSYVASGKKVSLIVE